MGTISLSRATSAACHRSIRTECSLQDLARFMATGSSTRQREATWP
jgi:hypothetical protein